MKYSVNLTDGLATKNCRLCVVIAVYRLWLVYDFKLAIIIIIINFLTLPTNYNKPYLMTFAFTV